MIEASTPHEEQTSQQFRLFAQATFPITRACSRTLARLSSGQAGSVLL
jgi:hypothetical protein